MTITNLDILKAVRSLVPNASFTVQNEDISTIVWEDDRTQPTQAAIQTALDTVIAEKPLNELRKERNRLLAETDWWVLPDRTATQAQRDYRQALRDITDTYTSLDTVVWPTKP